MIDLGKSRQKLYFIKLKNGKVLKLKLPTRAMLLDMIEMTKADEYSNEEAIDKLYEFLHKAFNRNVNDIEFALEEIEEMLDMDTAMLVLKDYMGFAFEKVGE